MSFCRRPVKVRLATSAALTALFDPEAIIRKLPHIKTARPG
jgi:hypothetical protein